MTKRFTTAWGYLASVALCAACSASTTVDLAGSGGAGAAGDEGGAGVGASGGSPPGVCPAGEELDAVASDEDAPTFLALDETHVYWSTKSAIRRAPRLGGAAETLADAQPVPMGLAVDDSYVYWADHDDPGIRRVAKAGGPWVVLAADIDGGGAFSMVVLDETHLYARGGCEKIVRMSKSGGPAEPLVQVDGCIGSIAIDEQSVYFAAGGAPGAILRVPKQGGPAQVLAPAEVGASGYSGGAPGIAVDAERVVWMSSDTGRVLGVPKDGGEVTVLATSVVMGQDVVSDGARVYWSEANAVREVSLGGDAATLVASPWHTPMGLALGAHHLFFTDYLSPGPVMRVCR